MTVKYLVTKDQITDTPTSGSTSPFSAGGAYTELNRKLSKEATVAEDGYVTTVKETTTGSGVYELSLSAPTAIQSDWNETTTTSVAYINNRPFDEIGTGLTVKDVSGVKKLTADTQLHFQIFESLPVASETYKQTIALVKKDPTSYEYYEYACVDMGTSASPYWKWEMIGTIDLKIEQTSVAITINGTALNTSTDSQIGLMSSSDHTDMQRKANLVTSWGTTTSGEKYPSEKLVKDSLDGKVDIDSATPSTLTTVMIGKDSNGYYFEDGTV